MKRSAETEKLWRAFVEKLNEESKIWDGLASTYSIEAVRSQTPDKMAKAREYLARAEAASTMKDRALGAARDLLYFPLTEEEAQP